MDCSQRKRTGFTLVELLVVIGIIALLISILLPTLQRAREAGNKISCASNMRQLGMAIEMYTAEYKNTYPPAWFEDDWKTVGTTPPYYGLAGHNVTWATLVRKYIIGGNAAKSDDPRKGSDYGVFKCPSDVLERASWLGGGTLSYAMSSSWGPDSFFNAIRERPKGQPVPGPGTTLNRGVGQRFDTIFGYPMWVKKNMVRPSGDAILLAERSYSEQAQTTAWNLGYQMGSPQAQMWSAGGVYGFPLNHATKKGKEQVAYLNYLFCDGHVQAFLPKETVRDKSTASPTWTWVGGDYMWTIRPNDYKNN